jgi:hypothetical protein
MNVNDKFIKFLNKLNIENSLLETIANGYQAIFYEGINAWDPNNSPYFPFVNPVGEPMGSYQNIMKQLPSQVTATGSAGDNTREEDAYKYEPALADPHRDMKEETIKEWENAPDFPKFKKTGSKFIKDTIAKANQHIPNVADNMFTPINYYANFRLGMYDVDNNRPSL